jgi:uncharacterized protein (TIGR02996 family)
MPIASMFNWLRQRPNLEPPPDMPELRAFLDAIRREPFEDGPKLLLADWLEENAGAYGKSRSELIRLQCAIEPLQEHQRFLDRHYGGQITPEFYELRRRIHNWHRRHGWPPPSPPNIAGISNVLFDVLHADIWSLSYGPSSVRLDTHDDGLRQFQKWLDQEPFRWVYQLRGQSVAPITFRKLASLPLLSGVKRFIFDYCWFYGREIAAVCLAPHLHESAEVYLSLARFLDPSSCELIESVKKRLGDRIHFTYQVLNDPFDPEY